MGKHKRKNLKKLRKTASTSGQRGRANRGVDIEVSIDGGNSSQRLGDVLENQKGKQRLESELDVVAGEETVVSETTKELKRDARGLKAAEVERAQDIHEHDMLEDEVKPGVGDTIRIGSDLLTGGKLVKGYDRERRHHRYSVVRGAVAVLVVGVVLGVGFGLGRLMGGVLWGHGSHDPVRVEVAEQKTGSLQYGQEAVLGRSRELAMEAALARKEAEQERLEKERQEREAVAVRAAAGKKMVALTFDDGPSPATTARLLDILRDKNVKATFFVVGTMAQRSPDLLQREEAEGHEVGSHTMAHTSFATMDATATQSEMRAINEVFQGILGHPVNLVRPPYGSLSQVAMDNVGKPLILWTVDPLDWKYRDAASVRQRAVADSFDGAVILLHDIHSTTVDAVAGIIDDLRAQGYEFLTISEMARARGVTMTGGVTYGSFRP